LKTSDIVPISLSRRELYDLVWAVPIPEAAARLGISRTWLTKICHRAGVPYPTRAYWGLLASGKRPARERLPAARDREDLIILRPRGRARGPGASVEAGEDDFIDLPDRLTRLHPVLTAWRVEIWHEQERLRREPWRKQGPPPAELGKRRLRLLDALLKSLERRGHVVESCGAPPGLLCVLVDGRKVEMVLRQDEQAVRRPPAMPASEGDAEAMAAAKPWMFSPPAPVMSLELHVATEPMQTALWQDQDETALEDRLAEIVAAVSRMVLEPPSASALSPGGDIADLHETTDDEDRRWQALRRIAARWDAVDRVRRMVETAKARAEAAQGGLTPAQADWLAWAEDWIAQAGLQEIGLEELMDAAGAPDGWASGLEQDETRPAGNRRG